MKHPLKITYILLFFFLLSQIVGLVFIAYDAQIIQTIDTQTNATVIEVTYDDTALGPRPEVTDYSSVIYLLVAIFLGTILLLFLMRFKSGMVFWKTWYFLAVFIAMIVTFGVIFSNTWAFLIALSLAILKIYYKKEYIHNITEVFIYTGIALLLVPLFSPLWVIVLLFALSIYDAYAVWKI